MYGPMWSFLLTYGSHDVTHRFPHVDDGHRDPGKWGVIVIVGKN